MMLLVCGQPGCDFDSGIPRSFAAVLKARHPSAYISCIQSLPRMWFSSLVVSCVSLAFSMCYLTSRHVKHAVKCKNRLWEMCFLLRNIGFTSPKNSDSDFSGDAKQILTFQHPYIQVHSCVDHSFSITSGTGELLPADFFLRLLPLGRPEAY